MDHGRKIGRTEAPRLPMKKPKLPFVTVTDPPFGKDEPIVEDNRLGNWKKWLKIHQKQYEAINKGTGHQSRRNMVMNSCERIRPRTELRNLTKRKTDPSVSDKNSADLAFWKIPPVLSNHGNPCLPDISPVLTKTELMLLPKFEHVDIPNYIKEEKNLPDLSEKASANTLVTLDQNTPEVADFVVIGGRRFGNKERNAVHIPTISIMDTSYENEDSEIESKRSILDPGVVMSLKINDFILTADERSISKSSESDPEEITYALKFSSKIHQMSKKCIHFDNQGTIAITYHWSNETNTSKILRASSKHETSFFFNKNKALLLPGQKVEFPIWFRKNHAGIFSESWRMVINPKVFKVSFVIHMWGYAASEYSDKMRSEIDTYIDRCIRNTAVQETIDEIICNVRLSKVPEPSYKSRYLERELFRTKNPSQFYHAGLVSQMYNLYESARVPISTASWTLSLIDLRHILLQIKDPRLRHEMLTVFSNLCQQCLKPCLYNSIRNTKYTVVYNILCGLVNRMEEESAFIKLNCILTDQESSIRTKNVLPSQDTPAKESGTSIPSGKRSTKTSRLSANSSLAPSSYPKPLLNDCTTVALYREVFYIRLYELLVDAVEQTTAAIDSLNNLNKRES